MIGIDTNILVYSHREDSEFHEVALDRMLALAEGSHIWAVPWPCIHEFIAITTHPRIYSPPTPLPMVFRAIEVWLNTPNCRPIGEGLNYLQTLEQIAVSGKIKGPMVYDARIAAICLHNGVTELWSADRDFSCYRQLRIRNPLVD